MGISRTDVGQHPASVTVTSRFSIVAVVATLCIAVLQLVTALRGRTVHWPSTALLIGLCSFSVINYAQSRALKNALLVVGLAFAIASIYGNFAR